MRSSKKDFIFFSLAGVAGFLVDACVVLVLSRAGINVFAAQAIAFTIAVTVTWILNRRFTFAHYASDDWLREWLQYVAANSVGAVVNNVIYTILVLTVVLFSKEPVFAVFAGSLAGLIFNFTASRTLVFRSR